MNIIEALSRDLNITSKQVESAISLIDEVNTLAFIARYRKELTGSLSDEVLRELNKKYVYYKSINERAKTILDSMEAQGVLTDELKDQINKCEKLTDLEDIYRPFKPKKKTRASIAKEKGLEPIAKLILEQNKVILEEQINQCMIKISGLRSEIVSMKNTVTDIDNDIKAYQDALQDEFSSLSQKMVNIGGKESALINFELTFDYRTANKDFICWLDHRLQELKITI